MTTSPRTRCTMALLITGWMPETAVELSVMEFSEDMVLTDRFFPYMTV